MLKRKFTVRETVLLLFMSILFLGIFYYLLVASPVNEEISKCSSQQVPVEDDISTELIKASRKKKMLDEMEQSAGEPQGELKPYNNLNDEMRELYQALEEAESYNISFSEARASGTIVRRDISIAFQAGSYEQVRTILRNMANSQFRCIVKDMDISASSGRGESRGMASAGAVSVSVMITYYETTVGASDTNGLVYDKDTASGDSEETME
ncbi:hypothetical protein [Hungatella hominis]|uniref:Type II secretion system protein M n=1 Tax=Hungatella hominis TaxID=2763050 RepID=A0ABR7H4Y2_9FIRM|nr:hypothetical protein [Hungatella hominis]MBC5708188.1 hypothetical protein [Hungatella hominis]